MNAHSIAARKQRTLAGKEGGHATARRNSPATIRTIRQEAAHTRFRKRALDECRTDAEREQLLADEPELERRAAECAAAEGRRIRAAKARKQQKHERAAAVLSAEGLVADFLRVVGPEGLVADVDFLLVVGRLYEAQQQIDTLQSQLAQLKAS